MRLLAALIHGVFLLLLQFWIPQRNMDGTPVFIYQTTFSVVDGAIVMGRVPKNTLMTIKPWVVINVMEIITILANVAAWFAFKDGKKQFFEELIFQVATPKQSRLYRVIEYTITAGLLDIAILSTIGYQDYYMYLMAVTSNLVIQLIGYIIELIKEIKTKYKQELLGLLYFCGFVLLTAKLFVAYHTAVDIDGLFRDGQKQTLFRALVTFYCIFYIAFAVHHVLITTVKKYSVIIQEDRYYVILSLTTKLTLAYMLVFMIRHAGNMLKIDHHDSGKNTNWDNVQGTVIFFGLTGAFLYPVVEVVLYYVLKKEKRQLEDKKARRQRDWFTF